jgi:hypothetical protein
MSIEKLYLEATKEASDPHRRDEALWAMALAISDGDTDKAKYSYIKMRVERLIGYSEKQSSATQQTHTSTKNPRGSLLLMVTKDFSLYEKSFIYEGIEYFYGGVSSVHYNGMINRINLINVGSTVYLSIIHDDRADESINVSSEAWVFQGRAFKNIGKAANIISQKTYQSRLARYLHKLKTDGYLTITKYDLKGLPDKISTWDVRIYENGDVTEKDLRFNLRTALKNKGLYIGYDTILGMEGKIDPHEVWVSETGKAIWNKKIKFDITTDYDVMSAIIKNLAGVNQQ